MERFAHFTTIIASPVCASCRQMKRARMRFAFFSPFGYCSTVVINHYVKNCVILADNGSQLKTEVIFQFPRVYFDIVALCALRNGTNTFLK